ncbi:MAG: relaxase/mobilization nuclease domain-containing protein [Pseudomonadota bacterium]
MPKTNRDRRPGEPLLDIGSYARRGPDGRSLSPEQTAQIARTVRRTPEVMVKVLRHGGKDQGAVQRHFDYLSRKGELDIETDDGQLLVGRGSERELLSGWDLDLEEWRPQSRLTARTGKAPPRLAHKLIFSMPAGTAPTKVLSAVREFCREEFALKHRYAMVLHTDEPHPHVHVVVKAVSEQGVRLNIKKADLRAWRAEFARQLRAQGVAANATERAPRGVTGLRKFDSIFRAMQRGASTHLRAQLAELSNYGATPMPKPDAGVARLRATRREVERGWLAVSQELERAGQLELAKETRAFVADMTPPRSDQEILAALSDAGRAQRSPDQGPGADPAAGRELGG